MYWILTDSVQSRYNVKDFALDRFLPDGICLGFLRVHYGIRRLWLILGFDSFLGGSIHVF